MLRAQRFPEEYQGRLMEFKRWTGLGFVVLTDLDLFLTYISTQSHHSIVINKIKVNVLKDVSKY